MKWKYKLFGKKVSEEEADEYLDRESDKEFEKYGIGINEFSCSGMSGDYVEDERDE